MKIAITGFQGERPILDERLLPENAAQFARNVYLKRGTLKPYKGVAAAGSLPATIEPANLYHYGSGNNGEGWWLSWGNQYDIDVVRSPIANDAYDRIYWTGQGAPKMASVLDATAGTGPYPSEWDDLGVPAPASAPSVSEPTSRGEVPAAAVETAYLTTWVTQYGEEGPPSDPSEFIMRWDDVEDAPAGGFVQLSFGIAPSTNQTITARRLYRTESGGQFQRVAELSPSTLYHQDNVRSQRMGAVLPSLDWDRPPAALSGLTLMPGGFMAGFFENTLCFCPPYRPHAWPIDYQLAFDEPIVGIAAVSGGLVVGTKGQPWMVSGSSPEAMMPMKLDVNQPCVSKRSMVDMGGYAVYASFDGLVGAGGNQANVITREFFSREQWLALSPETIHAYRYDGQYLAFYDGGCFAFTPGQGVQFFDELASGGYYDVTEDTLYLIQGSAIAAWELGDDMTYTWRSKVNEFPPGSAGFSCAKVIARNYPVTFKIIADGATVIDQEVTGPGMFRLPPGFTEARDWELEVSGTNEVNSVQIATSPGELV